MSKKTPLNMDDVASSFYQILLEHEQFGDEPAFPARIEAALKDFEQLVFGKPFSKAERRKFSTYIIQSKIDRAVKKIKKKRHLRIVK